LKFNEFYESQGIPINDKHFEVIIRKMSEKVKLETTGDTTFLPGEFVEQSKFEIENARVLSQGGEPATAQVVIFRDYQGCFIYYILAFGRFISKYNQCFNKSSYLWTRR